MDEKQVGFVFTFSSDTTKQILNGEIDLSTGGTRRDNGTVFEMGTPLSKDAGVIDFSTLMENDSKFARNLVLMNKKLDFLSSSFAEVKEIAWLQYASTNRLYEMTYEGFQKSLECLDYISSSTSEINQKLDDKNDSDNYELMLRYKSNLKSDAGIMQTKTFNATNMYSSIVGHLDEISNYLKRLFEDLKKRKGSDYVIFRSIICLIKPYCYVVRRYTMLYYYENGDFPVGYDDWVNIVDRILHDSRFRSRLEYLLRVNTEMNLEEVLNTNKKVKAVLKAALDAIKFDEEYAISHNKEEYLSLDKQLAEKIQSKDYHVIDGHLCIELK